MQRAAEGNPFYVQELLRNLEEDVRCSPRRKPDWVLGDLERVRVPALLQQVVEGRLVRLGETARDHLAVAAVIGQRVPLDVWRTVGGLTEDEVLQTVERAVEAQLLEAGDDGAEVAFAHALVREVLYEEILPPRRRVWHRRVAEALAGVPGADPDAVADHFQRAGDARAIDWLVLAGERAQGAYALLTARDRFLAAVALMEGDATRTRERGWVLYRVGRLLRTADPIQGVAYPRGRRAHRPCGWRPRAGRVCPVRPRIGLVFRAGAAPRAGDDGGRDRGARCPAAGLSPPRTGDRDLGRGRVAWAACRFRPGTGADALVNPRHGTLAVFLALAGRFAEARAIGEAYLTRVADLDHPDPATLSGIGDAEVGVALAEAAMGHPEPAQAGFRRALAAYRAIDHLILVGLPLGQELTEVNLPYRTTDVAARRSLLAEIRDAGTRVQALSQGWVRRFEVEALLLEGAWDEAERLAHGILDSVAPALHQRAFLGLGMLARWRGDPAAAWEHVRAGLPSGPDAEPGQHIFQNAVGLLALGANLALDDGDLPTAAAWLAAVDRWVRLERRRPVARGRPASLGALSPRRRRSSSAPGKRRNEALAEATDSAPAAGAAGGPPAPRGARDRIGAAYRGRCAPSGRIGARRRLCRPYERALTLLALAELRAAERKTAEATRLLAEVRAIGEPLGAVPLLARADELAAQLAMQPAPADHGPHLSAREIEVLRLVAKGRTNAEIADDLFVSHRTVTTHLTHIFAKLDVAGRAEAVALAFRLGLI